MPNRILRDGILSSEPVCALTWAEEVFYRRLMSVVDDHGRFHASPKLLRAACYPLQIDKVSDADIGKWTTSCVAAALVSVYPATDGKRYIQVEKFGQQVRSKSKYPEPIDKPLPTPDSNCEQPLADAHLGVFGVVGVFEGGDGGGERASAPARARASRLPGDWTLPPEWLAEGEGIVLEAGASVNLATEAQKFRDHWHGAAGQKGVKADWLATWRNWVRRACEYAPRSAVNGHGPIAIPNQADVEAALKSAQERSVRERH